MSMTTTALSLGVIAGAPRAAKACDPAGCEGWSAMALHTKGAIPFDGVIVLRGRYDAPEIPESALSAVSVTVTGPEQAAIEGSLELVDEPWRYPAMVALVWRPAAPLTPGVSYGVAIEVDNRPLGELCAGAPETLAIAGSVTASETLEAPALPPISTKEAFTVEASADLRELVCCDASGPEVGGCSVEAEEPAGCAALRGQGVILATLTADRAALAAAGDQVGLFGFDLEGEAMDVVFRADNKCTTPRGIVLSTGAILEGAPVCAGEDFAGLLGPIELDPNQALASCEAQPVMCGVSESVWDPKMCAPWEDWSGGGCGCRSGGGAGDAALMLVFGLLGLRRRARP